MKPGMRLPFCLDRRPVWLPPCWRMPDCSVKSFGTVAEDSVQMEVFQIEKNIRGLLVVATVSLLIGVLGTIQGLVGFYSQPGLLEGEGPHPRHVGAVYQALLSSALGLSIAIPAYLFYSYLASRSRQIVHSLERAGTEAVCLVCDARQRREEGESMAGRGV